MEKIAVGCDHAGYALKSELVGYLEELGYETLDLGANSHDRVDYPDYGAAVGRAITEGKADLGVLVCGSGIGISIAVNRFSWARAALVSDTLAARLCRQHNDANVLALGGRILEDNLALEIVKEFLHTE